MIWLRSLLFVGWFYLISVVLAVLYSIALPLPRPAMTEAIKFWGRLVMWGLRWLAGIKVEMRGLEHRPTGPALIAAKHQGMFDFIGPSSSCRRLFHPEEGAAGHPLLGWHASRPGRSRSTAAVTPGR